MTRTEYIEWCKQRAKAEFDFYQKDGIDNAIRNGLSSMMSDMNKNDETRNGSLQMLFLFLMNRINNKSEFDKFIDGFN